MKQWFKNFLRIFGVTIFFLFAYIVAFMQINFSEQVPILVYHCVGDNPVSPDGDGLFVSTETFEQQMLFLKHMGYTTIFAKDLDQPLPQRPIVITFDDGYENNYTEAFPILEKYNMKATIFVVGGMVNEPSKLNRLTWEQMKEMEQSGRIDIQSHTYNLHNIDLSGQYGSMKKDGETTEAYRARIIADLSRQKEAFITHLGHEPAALAFPNGYYNNELENIYLEHNYKLCFTIEPAIAQPTKQNYLLPRIPVFQWTHLPLELLDKTIEARSK